MRDMQCALRLLFSLFTRSFRSRRDLLLENLALRQQLEVLAQRNLQPRLTNPTDCSGSLCGGCGRDGGGGSEVCIIVTVSQPKLFRSTLAPAKSKPLGTECVCSDEAPSILRLSTRD